MLTRKQLKDIIQARLDDADALHVSGRYDGAIYLCGYAVELALKCRICITLRWPGFPSSKKEFEKYQSLKTHTLDVLLSLSGYEKRIKNNATTLRHGLMLLLGTRKLDTNQLATRPTQTLRK